MPRIQHKRGTAANLASVNPTPLAGELVWDSTENAIKIGDGATAWTSLAYVTATPRSHVHDGADITTGTVAYARLPVGSTASTVCAGDDARLTDARTPTAHKSTHATGGSDALTPSDIGAAPAASPAITGNATFSASSGVPVTITNTGTGNSFVVNDASGDTTPFVVDASGRMTVGGRAWLSQTLSGEMTFLGHNIRASAATANAAEVVNGSWVSSLIKMYFSEGITFHTSSTNYAAGDDYPLAATERMRIAAGGNVGIGRTAPVSALDVNGVITVAAGTAAAPAIVASGDPNTGAFFPAADTFAISTAGSERVRVDSSGRVGIGRTPSTAGTSLEVAGDIYAALTKSAFFYSRDYGIGTPDTDGLQIFSFDRIRFGARSSGTYTEYARLVVTGAGAGRLGIGTTSPSALLDINSDKIRLRTAKTPASASDTGNAGDICWDASYLYICTATNTWRRIAHSTW